MATSGTWAFNLDLGDIIEEAYERIGDELRTGYDYRTARRSLDLLLLEWQNRGLNLWTIKSTTQAITAGTAAYALSAEKVDVLDALMRTGTGTSQTDQYMTRISVNTYARISNKLQTGAPVQYYVERTPTAITLNLWPVPDTAQTYTMLYYYMERVEDSGKPGSNNVDVPARHLPALVSGLAYQLALKKPDKIQMAPALKQEYEEQWNLAADASREKASWFMRPEVGR
jgi:hypothetical protein